MPERFSYFILHNFFRLTFALLGLLLGLLWAIFGFQKALLILVSGLIGYLVGKRLDEGGSRGWTSRRPE